MRQKMNQCTIQIKDSILSFLMDQALMSLNKRFDNLKEFNRTLVFFLKSHLLSTAVMMY